MAPLKLLAELGSRQGPRLGCCLAVVTALLLACGGAAHAHYNTHVFSLDTPACTPTGSCGTAPFGSVTVSQDPNSHAIIDFTVTLNQNYGFNGPSSSTLPLFAVDITVVGVTFQNFQVNGGPPTTTIAKATGSTGNLGGPIGSFPYYLTTSAAFAGVLTFTATNPVVNGTLTPDNIASNNKTFMASYIIHNITGGGTGNIGAATVTPEPAGFALFAVALAGLGVVRNRRSRR